jgi:hypothetical protein
MMTPEERFKHIDNVFVRIAEGHVALQTAQINHEKTYARFVEEAEARKKHLDEKIANLTIRVDRLIARDLE